MSVSRQSWWVAQAKEGKGQQEEQKHERGRVEGEDGWAATEGRGQLKEVRQAEYQPLSSN